jgi:hypothetical protein
LKAVGDVRLEESGESERVRRYVFSPCIPSCASSRIIMIHTGPPLLNVLSPTPPPPTPPHPRPLSPIPPPPRPLSSSLPPLLVLSPPSQQPPLYCLCNSVFWY